MSSLVFRYESFKLSPHESAHIKTILDHHLQEGRLSKEPHRITKWFGVIIIRRIASAMLEEAVTSGVSRRDVVLFTVLSILLLSSLCCRSGDMTKYPSNQQKLPYLAYQDKNGWGIELENRKATVVIRNEKDHK